MKPMNLNKCSQCEHTLQPEDALHIVNNVLEFIELLAEGQNKHDPINREGLSLIMMMLRKEIESIKN